MQKTKRPKRRTKTKYVVLAAATALVVVVAAVIISYWPRTPPQKVSDYLKITYGKSLGVFDPNRTNATYVTISNLGLNITAVGGEANSILIQVDEGRMIDPDQEEGVVYHTLPKGQTWNPAILLDGCYLPVINGKCTVTIRIGCHEVNNPDPETIALEIPKDDIISPT